MKAKYLSAVLGVALFAGCQTQPSAPPALATIKCSIPTITALPETKESQEKGGLEIAVVPTLYKSVRKNKETFTQIEQPFGVALLAGDANAQQNKVYVEKIVSPYLETQPARLQFRVRVNNKLARVFRGQGSVVQFNVGGKLIPFNNIDYKEFLNGIVPPRNETEFTIYGPSLDLIAPQGTIGIFLYDVVTATDTAGNVTEKQNYEWYFNYTMKSVEETAAAQTQRGFMDGGEYQRAMARQQSR